MTPSQTGILFRAMRDPSSLTRASTQPARPSTRRPGRRLPAIRAGSRRGVSGRRRSRHPRHAARRGYRACRWRGRRGTHHRFRALQPPHLGLRSRQTHGTRPGRRGPRPAQRLPETPGLLFRARRRHQFARNPRRHDRHSLRRARPHGTTAEHIVALEVPPRQYRNHRRGLPALAAKAHPPAHRQHDALIHCSPTFWLNAGRVTGSIATLRAPGDLARSSPAAKARSQAYSPPRSASCPSPALPDS